MGGILLVCLMKMNKCDVIISNCLAQLCGLRTDLSGFFLVAPPPNGHWRSVRRQTQGLNTRQRVADDFLINKHQHGNISAVISPFSPLEDSFLNEL